MNIQFSLHWMIYFLTNICFLANSSICLEKSEDINEFHCLDEEPSSIEYCFSEGKESTDDQSFFTFDNYNLHENAQDFILETKEIRIPGYPYAFNPSIAIWQGKHLLSFRIRDAKTKVINQIGLIWLDKNLNLASHPYILTLSTISIPTLSKQQDPRLIVSNDRLYMIYSDALKGVTIPEVKRMFVTEIHFDGTKFFADQPEGLFYFENEREQRWEKNWTPFDYQGNLLLIYSLTPHRILRLLGNGKCETYASTESFPYWEWGVLRGGTPALREGNEYLSFFHSSLRISTLHSQGQEMPHYFMGAYTFSAEPPFAITQISPQPIIGKNFYTSPPYKTWRPLRVVFPGGFIANEENIWIVYGKQDFEIWVVKLDKKKLLQSLVPVLPKYE